MRRLRRLLETVCTWPARHPVAGLAVALALIALAVAAVMRLRADTTLEPMFARDDPAGRAMLRVLGRFSAAEELIVLATAPDTQPGPQPELLTGFAQRLAKAIEGSPDASKLAGSVVYRADDQTRRFFTEVLVPNGLFYLDDAAFAQAKQRLTREQMAEQFRRNEAMVSAPGPAAQALSKAFLQDPLRLHEFILDRIASSQPIQTYKGTDAFISPDGRAIIIRIAGKQPPSDIEFAKSLTREVTALAARENRDQLTIELTGSYAIATAAEAGIRRDMIITVTGSVVLLQLLFSIAFRRPIRLFLLAFGPVAIGVLYGFGVYAGFHPTITPITAVIGGILAGMAIDYTIQHLAHYDHLRRQGQSVRDAAMTSTTHVGPATFGACVTSIIGFLAVGSSSVPALRDFAILGSLGLFGALIGTIFIMPAILVLSEREAMPHAVRSSSRFRFERVLDFVDRHSRASVALCAVLLIGSIAVLIGAQDWLPLESDLTVMHPRPNAALDAQRHLAERFGGSPGSLLVYLKADSPDQLVALAHDVRGALSNDSARSAGITGVFGLSTLLPDPRTAPSRLREIGPDTARRVVSDFNAVVADTVFDPAAFKPYAGFLNHLLTRPAAPDIATLLPYRTLAATMLPRDASAASPPTESIMLVFAHGDLDERDTRQRVVGTIQSQLADHPGATLTGLSVLAHNTERNIHRDLPRLVLIAATLAGLYLFLHFRNLAAAALALLPGIFGMIALLAFIRLTGQKLNMINLAALPLLIGIDVDYGIFLVHLARTRRSDTGPADLAPAIQAIVLCAASMILGFASLITTSVPAVRSLGVLMAFGVSACLFSTLFLLLPLLLRRASKRDKITAATAASRAPVE